jgi:hypothetical protein
MQSRPIRTSHSTALLAFGLLLAGCSSNPPAATTQGAATTPEAPSSSAANPAPPAAPKGAHAGGRKGKIRQRAVDLAQKDAPSPCGLSNDKIYRLILTKNDNEDKPPCPVAATDAEKSALGDPWAQQVLLKGAFPKSVADIDALVGKISDMTRTSFVVGEGGMIPTAIADQNANRNLRYVINWKWKPGKPDSDIFLSARPGVHSTFLQVIAWDADKSWFNFYEYNDDTRVWSWTGNSTYASQAETKGHGCFDCHHNGMIIMKELAFPWNNWHSPQARISATVVPTEISQETWFFNKAEASILEGMVEGYQQTFHRNRIRRLVANNQINGVPDLLRSIISQSTVNLVSSTIKSKVTRTDDILVPSGLFIRDRLRDIVSPTLTIANTIPRATYNKFLTDHNYRLVQEQEGQTQYSMPGSTNFAFLVPAYSAEDDFITKQLLLPPNDGVVGIVDEQFEAAVMMVDFQNPIFSTVREGLLKYADQLPSGTLASKLPSGKPATKAATVSDVAQNFAALVEKGAQNQPKCNTAQQLDRCPAEQQFLYFWKQKADAWKADAAKRIQTYVDSVGKRITTPDGVSDYMRLAASRRAQMKNSQPIGNLVEFSLLFPQTDLPETTLKMNIDGTVSAN